MHFHNFIACILVDAWDNSCDPNETGCANLAAYRKVIWGEEFLQAQQAE